MSYPITPAPAIHNASPKTANSNPIIDELRSLISLIPELILQEVVQVIKQITGVDLSTAFVGLDLSSPGGILAAIIKVFQGVIDSIVGGLTGGTAIGNDITAIVQAFVSPLQFLQGIPQLLSNLEAGLTGQVAQLQGTVATNTANIATIQAATTTTLNANEDNFDRALIGPHWNTLVGALVIQVNDYVQSTGFGAGLYTAGTPLTDKSAVQITVTNKLIGRTRVIGWSDSTMTNYAGLEIYTTGFGDDYARIVTGTSPGVCASQAQVDLYQTLNGTVFLMKYDPASSTYTAFMNGNDIGLSWSDGSSLVTHGPGHRSTGIVTNGDGGFFTPGYAISDFKFYDWT